MIRLSHPKRERSEGIVPMINVAFLLLIFFLMVAVIVPPDPMELSLPTGEIDAAAAPDEDVVLTVTSDGRLLRSDGQEADLSGLSGRQVLLRADSGMDARQMASTLKELSAAEIAALRLAVAPE